MSVILVCSGHHSTLQDGRGFNVGTSAKVDGAVALLAELKIADILQLVIGVDCKDLGVDLINVAPKLGFLFAGHDDARPPHTTRIHRPALQSVAQLQSFCTR